MKLQYTISPIKFETIEELPNGWNDDKFRELLDIMEYGDTSDLSSQELKEMCLLSLTDNDPDEAAKIVLEYVFGERLNQGQIDNISHEIINERMWEEYADLSLHEDLFNVTQILHKAYNGKFPHPEAVRLRTKISSKEKRGIELLLVKTEASLIRLLDQGMPENTLISRLFKEQLKGGDFEDAQHIIWQYKVQAEEEDSVVFELISSSYWLHDLKYAENFEGILVDEDSVP